MNGLLVGASYLNQDPTTVGRYVATSIPFGINTDKDHTTAFCVESSGDT